MWTIVVKFRVRLGSVFCASLTHVYVSEIFFFPSRNFLTFLPWTVLLCTVHGSHKSHFSTTFSLKMGPTILFTHLKIILLQCFHILVFNFSKISSIQTDSMSLYIILREQLMSSASEHWTRCDADTCPYPNRFSDHWSLYRSPTLWIKWLHLFTHNFLLT